MLLYRMAKFGRGRMPHLGSEWPDAAGLDLIAEGVRGMKGGNSTTDTATAGPKSTPDLSTIGKARTRADLLESLIDPSRRVEPRYVAHTAQAADGRSVTGVLAAQDDRRVAVRDAQNKVHEFAAADVGQVRASRQSLEQFRFPSSAPETSRI